MSIYKGQSLLQIVLDVGLDLSTATNQKVLYRKPSGVKGEWNAVKSGTTLTYDIADGDLNESGEWMIQAYFEQSGKKAFGELTKLKVDENIKQ